MRIIYLENWRTVFLCFLCSPALPSPQRLLALVQPSGLNLYFYFSISFPSAVILGRAATAARSEDPVFFFIFVWIARSSRAMTGKKVRLDCPVKTALGYNQGPGNDSRAAYPVSNLPLIS